jgi:hypothetical protein
MNNIAIFTTFPEHYEGYIRIALDEMGFPCVQISPSTLKEHVKRVDYVLCFHSKDATEVMGISDRKSEIILLSHQVLPVGDRSLLLEANADHLICNGSAKLIRELQTDGYFNGIKYIHNIGYFPTMYASCSRCPKTVFVQMTPDKEGNEYEPLFSGFTRQSLCQWLLLCGFQVNYFEHCYHRDVTDSFPSGVRRVKPGKDYMQSLTGSKYFIGHGTTAPLTNTFTAGAVNFCTSEDWWCKQSAATQSALTQCTCLVDDFHSLFDSLDNATKYSETSTEYLFGVDRLNVSTKVRDTILSICR